MQAVNDVDKRVSGLPVPPKAIQIIWRISQSCSAELRSPTQWRMVASHWLQACRPQTSWNQKVEIPETPHSYLTSNQSKEDLQADHACCDPRPNTVFKTPAWKPSRSSDLWKHELPFSLPGPATNLCYKHLLSVFGFLHRGHVSPCSVKKRKKNVSVRGRFTSHHQHNGSGKLTCGSADVEKEEEGDTTERLKCQCQYYMSPASVLLSLEAIQGWEILLLKSQVACCCTNSNIPPKLFPAGYTPRAFLSLLALGILS